jgi:acyl-CoA synthetase (AMP-forming)/AMP-acid ligase II
VPPEQADERTYLRTGDLGFLDGADLFVTGRLKDLIIIRGHNHYPQDIELTVERSHPGLRPGGGAAFTVGESDGDRLVVVQEIDRRFRGDPRDVFAPVRRRVSEEHGLQIHDIALIPAGSMPKTTSGKIRRSACRSLLLNGDLSIVARWSAPGRGNGIDSAKGEPERPESAPGRDSGKSANLNP